MSSELHVKSTTVFCSDVTIIESEIKIAIFFENRIESKSIFWLVFVIDFDSQLLAKTTHCSKFKAWQSEPRRAEYADLITIVLLIIVNVVCVHDTQQHSANHTLLQTSYAVQSTIFCTCLCIFLAFVNYN